MIRLFRRLTKAWRGEEGITLLEMLITVGLLTMGVAMVGAPIFASLQNNQDWRDDLSATANLRQAASWLSQDAKEAEGINLDASGEGSQVVLTEGGDELTMWWETSDGTHEVSYALQDEELRRSHRLCGEAASTGTVARRVDAVTFTRDDEMLTMDLTVLGGEGQPVQQTSQVALLELEGADPCGA